MAATAGDRIRIIAGTAGRDLGQAICAELGRPLSESFTTKYYNGCTYVQVRENVREADVFVVQSSTEPVNDHLMELLMLIDACKGASAQRVTAVLPIYPYQQSDWKDQPRIAITARLVADLLLAAGADRVLTIDLHAAQIQGFMSCPCDNLTALPIVAAAFREQGLDMSQVVAVATDVGRAKLVRRYARRLDLPLAIIDKERLDERTVRAVNVIGDVEGKDVILFDDIIGTGGSLVSAANLLREHGARRIFAGAVHAVLAAGAVERLEASVFEGIVITDTVPSRHKLKDTTSFRVLSVAPLLAEAIRRIHLGESVSALFDD